VVLILSRDSLIVATPAGLPACVKSLRTTRLWWALLPEPRRKEVSPDLRSAAPSASIIHSRLCRRGAVVLV
jgi:hypothetical protein